MGVWGSREVKGNGGVGSKGRVTCFLFPPPPDSLSISLAVRNSPPFLPFFRPLSSSLRRPSPPLPVGVRSEGSSTWGEGRRRLGI